MVKILHISDLRFFENNAISSVMWNTLLKEVERETRTTPPGEKLLIVTGDFHSYCDADYSRAMILLHELVHVMDLDMVHDVFVVPGNHDVGNDAALEPLLGPKDPFWKRHQKAARTMLQNSDEYIHIHDFLEEILPSFLPYCNFVKELGIYPVDADPLFPASVHVRCWRNKLNLLHLNTALVNDGTIKGNQLVDIYTASAPSTWSGVQKTLPALAIGHNSFYDLAQFIQSQLLPVFLHCNISAYLSGRTHRTERSIHERRILISVYSFIPNIVCTKESDGKNDVYSEFGFYWLDWDEETNIVKRRFLSWQPEEGTDLFAREVHGLFAMRCFSGKLNVSLHKAYDKSNFKDGINMLQFYEFDITQIKPLSREESARFQALEERFAYCLSSYALNIRVEAKHFSPEDVPAVIVESEFPQADESLFSIQNELQITRVIEDTGNEVQRKKAKCLVLNAGHALINNLLEITDSNFLEQMILAIYNNAMIFSDKMSKSGLTFLHYTLVLMMNHAVTQYKKRKETENNLKKIQKPDMKQPTASKKPDHIRIFFITPYKDEFRKVEQAVRNVLENAPYFFEVRLARDYTHSGGELVSDLQKHIEESHAFLADITGLNPNVMMEVGAIRLTGDKRPLLVIKANDQKTDSVADLGDKIWISYGSLNDSVEDIQKRIQESLAQDGEYRREDIQVLLEQRKKRFLAASLLRRLSDTKLTDREINIIRKSFITVESLLEADDNELNRTLKFKPHKILSLREELRELL